MNSIWRRTSFPLSVFCLSGNIDTISAIILTSILPNWSHYWSVCMFCIVWSGELVVILWFVWNLLWSQVSENGKELKNLFKPDFMVVYWIMWLSVEQICFSKASMAEWNDGGSTECPTCTELQSLTEELVALEVAGQRFEQWELVMVQWFWSLSVQSMAWSEDAWKCWRQIQVGLWIASLAD